MLVDSQTDPNQTKKQGILKGTVLSVYTSAPSPASTLTSNTDKPHSHTHTQMADYHTSRSLFHGENSRKLNTRGLDRLG